MAVENIGNALNEVETETLSQNEEKVLKSSFERLLEDVRTFNTEAVRRKKQEYLGEVMLGAEIARAQFGQKFGGGSTTAGKFVISQIDSGFFGYDDWYNAADVTAGTTDTWIDSDAPDNLAGTADEPIRIGADAVHVVLGVGNYAASPKSHRFKFEVNREPKTVIRAQEEFYNTDLKVKWLQSPYLLYEDTEFYAQRFPSATGVDLPYLVGVSFVEGKAARLLTPSTFTGTQTANTIVVEQ